MTETFYELLGVDTDASTAEIEAAYREQLKRTHPDVSDDDDASERTQSLIEARDVLTDAEERERYDRLGHESYVSEDNIDSPTEAARNAASRSTSTDSADTGPQGPNRSRRERRARQRVNQERASNRSTSTTSAATEQTEQTQSTGTNSERAETPGPQWRNNTTESYSVRQPVETERSYIELLPSGRNATLFGIVFALYPVLLFSALIPAFPLFVNILIAACALLLVGYLQSMPSVALLVFGSWSLVTPLVLLALNISALSIIGFAALCGTWLPFGFSILTASVLRL